MSDARNYGIPRRISDPSEDWYRDVVWVEPPGYVQKRRVIILRRCIYGVGVVILCVLMMAGFLAVSGQAVP